ncbi:hypothetical protein [Geochorda subterranea]|uniref:Methyl-accepting transducer domain-containing protein n=1 Tax=Geochorda subterranea TaxID=3109564 RepID=A0ABZ1BLJ6_9FIRM|nr:hypothetical protein [Limnochorda sp. LNt]WRP13624.1 hypothetical protein VLY81_09190 [Limnochorda sp. LNt]
MSQQAGGPATGRAAGVAQVSALAVPPVASRGVTGHFVAVGVILVALALAGGWYVSGHLGRGVIDAFSVLYDAWQEHDNSLAEVQAQIQGLQRQLSEWGALDETGAPGGVLVISRDQARDVAQRLSGAATTVDSLRRVVSQRQSIIGRTSETLGRDVRASLWALAAGILVAALIGGGWLARVSARPLGDLRRQLQLADQGQQALATALGPWFTRVGDGLGEQAAEAARHLDALAALQAKVEAMASAARRLDREATSLADGVEAFRALADRVREFGGESKVLALSAAIESARMEGHAHGVGVVAEELRRVASEAKETVRLLAELEGRLEQAAAGARKAAAEAGEEADQGVQRPAGCASRPASRRRGCASCRPHPPGGASRHRVASRSTGGRSSSTCGRRWIGPSAGLRWPMARQRRARRR